MSLSWGIRSKENPDSNKFFDLSSTKSVNGGRTFSFPMDYGDIFSFEAGWDCSTDLHMAASFEQLDGTFSVRFYKMQGYGFGFLIDIINATMCRASLQ